MTARTFTVTHDERVTATMVADPAALDVDGVFMEEFPPIEVRVDGRKVQAADLKSTIYLGRDKYGEPLKEAVPSTLQVEGNDYRDDESVGCCLIKLNGSGNLLPDGEATYRLGSPHQLMGDEGVRAFLRAVARHIAKQLAATDAAREERAERNKTNAGLRRARKKRMARG